MGSGARRAGLVAGLAAVALVSGASAAAPRVGLLVTSKSLGGLRLGSIGAQVNAAWGSRHGVCRDCREQTWYFNLRKFEPQGAGLAFRRGRVVALFTVWSPQGWHTDRGLRIDDPAARIAGLYGSSLLRVDCGTYAVLLLRRGRTTTSFYVVDERVWGFGLSRLGEPACR
ncbi:MAG TPA: hypothetical protein VK488_00310 [Gaiellaceae bacterium]|nr:hypothetical protein [Gaiellaceae bacterium]